MSNQAVYQLITDRICKLLEQGVAPWRATWSAGKTGALGTHRNFVTGHVYRSTNAFMTYAVAIDRGYSEPLWLTFKQALSLGGHVRRGEKGTPIVYASRMTITDRDEATGEISQQRVPFLRYYTAFNVAQCEGINYEQTTAVAEPLPFSPIEECERIVAAMPTRPGIAHSETIECPVYDKCEDRVTMPSRERFELPEFYYSALFHEITHATGHASRLDRHDNTGSVDSCEGYAKEELVAEMGAAFLAAVAGIEQPVIPDAAMYLAGWLSALRNDSRMLISAAAHAQRAADYILNAEAVAEQADGQVAC